MDKKEAIELLNKQLQEVPQLKKLNYVTDDGKDEDNIQKLDLWTDKCRIITEEGLGPNDRNKLPLHSGHVVGFESQEDYTGRLIDYETALKKIIQKYELLGVKEKPATLKYQIPGVDNEPTGTVETPVNLFDNMKLHPSIVEASRSCFIAGNYREAILNAFIGLIDHIKELTGLDLDGDDLMNKVFSLTYDKERRKITKYPIIRINDLKNSNDRNEQQGFMFLCKGAAGAIRNPKAHKLVTQSNHFHTLEYLAFASLLRRRIDESKLVKSDKEEH